MKKDLRKFKEIKYESRQDFRGKVVRMNMLIPGVNSGVYTPALHVTMSISENKIFGRTRLAGSMTLSINDVIELRDECNLIIKEAEKQKRIN